jgi:hypothetical protein
MFLVVAGYSVILAIALVAIYMAFSQKDLSIFMRSLLVAVGLSLIVYLIWESGYLRTRPAPTSLNKLVEPLLR